MLFTTSSSPKNLVLLPALLFLMMLFATSCEHCMECEYDYYDPEVNDSLTFTYEEFCGRKAEVENYKQEAEKDAAEVNGKLNCTEREAKFAF